MTRGHLADRDVRPTLSAMGTRTTALVASGALAGLLLSVPAAQAQLEIGRTVTSVTPVVLASTGVLDMQGTLTVVVTETAAVGVPDWSVTLSSTDLATTGAPDIPAGNLEISDRATVPVGIAGGIAVVDPSGGESLASTRTLFTVTGESALSAYNGVFTHTAAIDLAIPNGATKATYLSTITVTIVQ